jgi:hypothetical protein
MEERERECVPPHLLIYATAVVLSKNKYIDVPWEPEVKVCSAFNASNNSSLLIWQELSAGGQGPRVVTPSQTAPQFCNDASEKNCQVWAKGENGLAFGSSKVVNPLDVQTCTREQRDLLVQILMHQITMHRPDVELL